MEVTYNTAEVPISDLVQSDPINAEVRVSHDRFTFVLRDWRGSLLGWALGLALCGGLGLVTRQLVPSVNFFAVSAMCLSAWLLSSRRVVHLTTQHVELVDRSRVRPERVRRYPLEQIVSHGIIEANGRPLLRIELPDCTLALPADRQQLATASAMLKTARREFAQRERGSEGDVPVGLRRVAKAAREPEGR